MRWNWQRPDWPEFRVHADRIRTSVDQFLKGSGVVIGALHHLDADARDGLAIELISQEVVDSSAIEGEILDRDRVQSSLARHLGFATDQRRANIPEMGAAEASAAELMADVYRNHAAPLSDQTLFAWHAILMNGRRDIADVGRYASRGLGVQLSGQHGSRSFINLTGGTSPSVLRFSPLTTFNLRAFTEGQRLSPSTSWLKGTRFSLLVINIGNGRQKVRD